MMQKFRADLHIHTLLSPCADLEMTPKNIVMRAKETGLQIIGIADHNSTRNALLVKKEAAREEIFTLTGAEITTKEEVHCLAFFEHAAQLEKFQQFIDEKLIRILNPDGHFGYQPVIREDESIVELVPWFLPAALDAGISEVQKKVFSLNGIFIPAHIDRPSCGLIGQLGFIPENLEYDALEISRHGSKKYVEKHGVLKVNNSFLRSSDAHYLPQIGEICSVFNMFENSFKEIKKALNQLNGRFVDAGENNC